MRGLAAVTALVLLLSVTPAVAEPSDAGLRLPEPTGTFAVGTTSLHLRDDSRRDPWVPSLNRELMVSLFYPAASAHGPTKQYLTPAESRALLQDDGITGVPPEILSTVDTNAVVDARPAGRAHSLPLVVLSPGFKKPRATLSTVAYTPGLGNGAADTWEAAWPLLTGWKRWLLVEGMEHASFTDIGVLAAQLGLDIGADVDAERAATITRSYVTAFFDLHLRGEWRPQLERPSPEFPEVSFADPS
ncbi:hypothetical protein ACWGRK_06825 [Saccharomonospora azurea]